MATDIQTPLLPAKTVHYLPSRLLVGNFPDYSRDRLDLFTRLAQAGDVYGLHFGPFPMLFFNRPDHIHSILVEHAYDFDKGSAIHSTFRPTVGDGIFSSEGDFHRKQRKLIAPSFQPRQISTYADIMGYYSEQIQQTWTDGEIVDINQQMTNLTMSIIGKALFDADVFTETDELGAAMAETQVYAAHRLASLIPPPYSWPTPGNNRMRHAMKVLRGYLQAFVDERRNHPGDRQDFLSLLLQARDEDGRPMSDQQLMAESLTLFGAGHETTATALAWTWYLLCQHPEHYQKVHQEVDQVLQGRTPTYADLARLPYCLQVFKEAMRIYPPAYVMARTALHDVVIDGYKVAKGNVVMMAPYTLHRREDNFPHPEIFEPERFEPEREKQLPRYAYMPFGAGPRICIGMHFAMMEGHLLLAALAQRAHFTMLPDQNIEMDPVHHLTLRPSRPINVRVEKR